MPSLAFFLNRTQEMCESIESLKFRAPGIFTNSIIAEPPITTLLKDAEEHESALYRIKKPIFSSSNAGSSNAASASGKSRSGGGDDFNNGASGSGTNDGLNYKPERVDGKSIFVDQSFSDFTNAGAGTGAEDATKRTAVVLPEIISPPRARKRARTSTTGYSAESSPVAPPSSSSSQTHQSNKLFKLFEETSSSADMSEILSEALDLIKKYPSLLSTKEQEELVTYSARYEALKQEIKDLEKLSESQKNQLAEYNIALNDSLLLSSPSRAAAGMVRSREGAELEEEEVEVDIDVLISQEEKETRELEERLEELNQAR